MSLTSFLGFFRLRFAIFFMYYRWNTRNLMSLLLPHLLVLLSYLLARYVLVSCSKEEHFHVIFNLNNAFSSFSNINIWNLINAERLDPDTSGILSTLCDHSFQCSCTSKWTYLSCQVSGSPSCPFSAFSLYMVGWCCIFGFHLVAVFTWVIHFVPYVRALMLACFWHKMYLIYPVPNKYLAWKHVLPHTHFVCRFVECVNNKMRY